jgi:hypothetical protein
MRFLPDRKHDRLVEMINIEANNKPCSSLVALFVGTQSGPHSFCVFRLVLEDSLQRPARRLPFSIHPLGHLWCGFVVLIAGVLGGMLAMVLRVGSGVGALVLVLLSRRLNSALVLCDDLSPSTSVGRPPAIESTTETVGAAAGPTTSPSGR